MFRLASKSTFENLIKIFENIDIREDPILKKDLSKVKFDFENISTSTSENYCGDTDICGPSLIGNLDCIVCWAGGDWEYPVLFIVYLDKNKKTLRGYIPKEGNVYNHKNKHAFGNDEEEDIEFLNKWVKKNKPDEFFEDKIYDIDSADLMFDKDLIFKDVIERIKVVP